MPVEVDNGQQWYGQGINTKAAIDNVQKSGPMSEKGDTSTGK